MSLKSIKAFNAFTGRAPAPSITPSCFPRARSAMEACAEDVRRFDKTGELPAPWPEVDEEFDRRVDEMNRELDAIESGCVDSDDERHPNHEIHCVRPCCGRRER
jgi:hypothetical protein